MKGEYDVPLNPQQPHVMSPYIDPLVFYPHQCPD